MLSLGAMVGVGHEVGSKVGLKFDAWHRELVGVFARKLEEQHRILHASIERSRARRGVLRAQGLCLNRFLRDAVACICSLSRPVPRWSWR